MLFEVSQDYIKAKNYESEQNTKFPGYKGFLNLNKAADRNAVKKALGNLQISNVDLNKKYMPVIRSLLKDYGYSENAGNIRIVLGELTSAMSRNDFVSPSRIIDQFYNQLQVKSFNKGSFENFIDAHAGNIFPDQEDLSPIRDVRKGSGEGYEITVAALKPLMLELMKIEFGEDSQEYNQIKGIHWKRLPNVIAEYFPGRMSTEEKIEYLNNEIREARNLKTEVPVLQLVDNFMETITYINPIGDIQDFMIKPSNTYVKPEDIVKPEIKPVTLENIIETVNPDDPEFIKRMAKKIPTISEDPDWYVYFVCFHRYNEEDPFLWKEFEKYHVIKNLNLVLNFEIYHGDKKQAAGVGGLESGDPEFTHLYTEAPDGMNYPGFLVHDDPSVVYTELYGKDIKSIPVTIENMKIQEARKYIGEVLKDFTELNNGSMCDITYEDNEDDSFVLQSWIDKPYYVQRVHFRIINFTENIELGNILNEPVNFERMALSGYKYISVGESVEGEYNNCFCQAVYDIHGIEIENKSYSGREIIDMKYFNYLTPDMKMYAKNQKYDPLLPDAIICDNHIYPVERPYGIGKRYALEFKEFKCSIENEIMPTMIMVERNEKNKYEIISFRSRNILFDTISENYRSASLGGRPDAKIDEDLNLIMKLFGFIPFSYFNESYSNHAINYGNVDVEPGIYDTFDFLHRYDRRRCYMVSLFSLTHVPYDVSSIPSSEINGAAVFYSSEPSKCKRLPAGFYFIDMIKYFRLTSCIYYHGKIKEVTMPKISFDGENIICESKDFDLWDKQFWNKFIGKLSMKRNCMRISKYLNLSSIPGNVGEWLLENYDNIKVENLTTRGSMNFNQKSFKPVHMAIMSKYYEKMFETTDKIEKMKFEVRGGCGAVREKLLKELSDLILKTPYEKIKVVEQKFYKEHPEFKLDDIDEEEIMMNEFKNNKYIVRNDSLYTNVDLDCNTIWWREQSGRKNYKFTMPRSYSKVRKYKLLAGLAGSGKTTAVQKNIKPSDVIIVPSRSLVKFWKSACPENAVFTYQYLLNSGGLIMEGPSKYNMIPHTCNRLVIDEAFTIPENDLNQICSAFVREILFVGDANQFKAIGGSHHALDLKNRALQKLELNYSYRQNIDYEMLVKKWNSSAVREEYFKLLEPYLETNPMKCIEKDKCFAYFQKEQQMIAACCEDSEILKYRILKVTPNSKYNVGDILNKKPVDGEKFCVSNCASLYTTQGCTVDELCIYTENKDSYMKDWRKLYVAVSRIKNLSSEKYPRDSSKIVSDEVIKNFLKQVNCI